MKSRYQSGFTLLEMVLAITIFAIVSLAAYQVLNAVLRNSEISQAKATQLTELQYALTVIEQDLRQAIVRPSSQGLSDFTVTTGKEEQDSDGILLLRNNWANPGNLLPRSQLQKVGYQLEEDILQRISYGPANSLPLTPIHKTTLIQKITKFQLRFFNQGAWQRTWLAADGLPTAVEITLEIQGLGQVQRLIMPTASHNTLSTEPSSVQNNKTDKSVKSDDVPSRQ